MRFFFSIFHLIIRLSYIFILLKSRIKPVISVTIEDFRVFYVKMVFQVFPIIIIRYCNYTHAFTDNNEFDCNVGKE